MSHKEKKSVCEGTGKVQVIPPPPQYFLSKIFLYFLV